MDPITATIVWGVIWFFLIPVGWVIIYFGILALGALIGAPSGREKEGAAIAFLPALILAIIWEIFAVIQVIIHIVTLVQLLWPATN